MSDTKKETNNFKYKIGDKLLNPFSNNILEVYGYRANNEGVDGPVYIFKHPKFIFVTSQLCYTKDFVERNFKVQK